MESAQTKKSWSDRLAEGMEFLAPLFDQPHLASIRDGFVAMMPLLIVGALVLVVLQFPLSIEDEVYLDSKLSPELVDALWVPFNMTFGLLSVYVLMSITYSLSRRRGLDPIMPLIFTFLSFIMVASPQLLDGEAATFLDNSGLFTAIIVAVITVEVYKFFIDRNLYVSMPAGVPPAISNAFIALIPGAAIIFGWWAIRFLLNIDLAGGLFDVLSRLVPAASTYVAAAVAETFHGFLWTLGIHGDLTIGIVLEPVWTSNLADNVAAVAAGQDPPHIYTSIFRSYVVPGGSGATLPLAIYFIRSKSARLRRVGWLGVWPGIFNINEPITFGAPIVFNPVLAIPFILITFVNVTVAWAVTSAGLVTAPYIPAPWTLPTPLLMFMATGFDGGAAVLAVVTEFVIPGVIWYPAFKAWEKMVLEKEEGAVMEAEAAPSMA